MRMTGKMILLNLKKVSTFPRHERNLTQLYCVTDVDIYETILLYINSSHRLNSLTEKKTIVITSYLRLRPDISIVVSVCSSLSGRGCLQREHIYLRNLTRVHCLCCMCFYSVSSFSFKSLFARGCCLRRFSKPLARSYDPRDSHMSGRVFYI